MNPIHEQQLADIEKTEIGMEIFRQARNELYLSMRFLDVALSSLQFVRSSEVQGVGTDGNILYFQPEPVFEEYKKSRNRINRAYLHMIIHCLFRHLTGRKEREEYLWNLSCDITAEFIIDGLYQKCVHLPKSPFRRSFYKELTESVRTVTAEGVYRYLEQKKIYETEKQLLQREFFVDDHSFWEQEQPNKNGPSSMQQKWDDIRERMQTEMESFSKEASKDSRSLLEQVQIENRQRYDYKEFLRKFSVLKEEMKVDMDSFDYIFYNYGMRVYGNMPLIEPLETKESQKIEEFVIVIDTSMSCKGELVKHFLEETYSVLSESESFFRRIHIRIIQCDERVQSDRLITSGEELADYMAHFTIKGQGGTDFRPAFTYVNELVGKRAFQKLKGLIYFTDGYGTFPVQMPPYETAFVFLKQDYRDVDVPPWAIKLILDEEEF